jgi:pterin-4a-carbinolamine dehydratase
MKGIAPQFAALLKPPNGALGLPAPRPKIRRYKYVQDENPSLPAIVFDIIDGLSIQEVEPELYPNLRPLLCDRERALKEWRNQPASKSIGDAIEYITHYRYADDPNQLQPRSLRSVRITSNKLSPMELGINLSSAMRGEFDDIDPRHYKSIIRELHARKADALSNGDYLLAERIVSAYRRMVALSSVNRFKAIATSRVDGLGAQLEVKTEDRDDLVERAAQSIAEAERKRDADLRQMERANERELKKFDKQFDMDPPPALRKFSPTFLQLRVREKYMVQAGRYAEATQTREEADKLEQQEREEQRERWVAQLRLQRQELQKRQQEKMYIRTANANNQIAQMRRQSGAAISHQEKAVQHLEHQHQSATVVQNFASVTDQPNTARRERRLPKLKRKAIDPDAVQFRQRAMVNAIVYSRTARSPDHHRTDAKDHLQPLHFTVNSSEGELPKVISNVFRL